MVRNAIRHVRGLFAGTTDYGINYIEIGNEPDLAGGSGTPINYFWTGTRSQWIAMYNAIAAEIVVSLFPDADSSEVEGPFRRVVLLPLRPLDLEEVLDAGDEGGGREEEDEDGEAGDGVSLSQCLQTHPALLDGLDEGTVDVVTQLQGSAADLADLLPFSLPVDCL